MLSVWHWFASLFLPSFKCDFRLKEKKQMPFVAGKRRLSARAVKAAGLRGVAFIEAKRRALTELAGGSGAGFSQEGQRVQNLCERMLSGSREAAGRRNWPEAVPRKMRSRKRVLTEISEYQRQKQT